MRSLACTTAAALLAAGIANSVEARVLYHWVELGDGETATSPSSDGWRLSQCHF